MTEAAKTIKATLPSEVPSGWRQTTLGKIGEYINGRGFKKSEWSNKGLPIIRIQNLTGSGKEQNYYGGKINEQHVVNPGDLLISWAATLGAYLWAGPRAALNQHIFKVRSFVDKRFHYYLMQHILNDLYRQTHGSGMVHITKSKFDSTPILIPETEDQQKRIVEEIEKQFSRLDEAVADLKRVKANLKRYKAAVLKAAVEGHLVETEAELARKRTPSPLAGEGGGEGESYETGEQLLQRILEIRRSEWKGKGKYKEPASPDTADLPELPEGWVWARLDAIAALKGGITVDSKRQDPTARSVPYLRVANVQRGYLDLSEVKSIDAPESDIKDLRLQRDDILFNEGGDRDKLGRGWIWEAQLADCIHQNHVFRARLFLNEVSSKLVSWWGNSFGKDYFMREGKQTTNLASINLTKLSAFPIPLPPVAEQMRLVAEVERRLSLVAEVEAQVGANLRRAKRMRQLILGQAFSGSLVIYQPQVTKRVETRAAY